MLFVVPWPHTHHTYTSLHMDVIKYRHYVVSDAKYCCIACNKGDVLVRKGHAYYLNKHKVVVGYQIANSTVPYTVFLPVFSFYRESFLSKIRNGINKFAKFTVATFRMKLYMKEMDEISKKVLKKPFPMVLLHIIGLYCYDPFLLVKR